MKRLLPVATLHSLHARRFLLVVLLASACGRVERASVRDDAGRAVAVPKAIHRVVTLAPNLTEIVFAVGAGSRVVATDTFSDTPAAAKALPKVGGIPPNVERIASARPDLVLALAAGGYATYAAALSSLHIPLFVVRTERIADVPRAMREIGRLLGAPEAEAAAAAVESGMAKQQRHRQRPPKVLFAIWTDPLYVAGQDTFGNDLLTLAGAQNAVQTSGWSQYSLESVVANPPDLILYPDKSVKPAAVEALLRAAPELRARTTAVAVNENLFTRPSPRLVEAARSLNAILDAWEAGHRGSRLRIPNPRSPVYADERSAGRSSGAFLE
jgi:ABC-type hemin transport system substrate-binding protein